MLNDLLARFYAAIAAFNDPDYMLDAKRYQYMRNSAVFRNKNGPGLYWYLPRYLHGSEGAQLDASIDASFGD